MHTHLNNTSIAIPTEFPLIPDRVHLVLKGLTPPAPSFPGFQKARQEARDVVDKVD
jgi:hypothetical protein